MWVKTYSLWQKCIVEFLTLLSALIQDDVSSQLHVLEQKEEIFGHHCRDCQVKSNSASVQNEQVKQHFTEHLSVEVTLVKVWL